MLGKELEDKKLQLKIYENSSNRIKSNLIEKGKSYLDWIEFVYLNEENNAKNCINFNIIKKKEILKSSNDNTIIDLNKIMKNKIENTKDDMYVSNIRKVLDWKYKNYLSTQIPSKASVTKLKELEKNNNIIKIEEKNINQKDNNILTKPKFLNEQEKLTGAEKGTVMHLILQKLNIRKRGYTRRRVRKIYRNVIFK